jgi:hypothetical protein
MRKATRLDAVEKAFLFRQLEAIDDESYKTEYPELMARDYIPSQPNIPDWARIYTWSMTDRTGQAKFINSAPSDIPNVEVQRSEGSKFIKTAAAEFKYEIDEIKAARATNTPLDQDRADACQEAVLTKVDTALALGDTPNNLEGLLTQSGAATYTWGNKASTGTAPWVDSNNKLVATPDEILADVTGMVTARLTDLRQAGGPVFQRFTLLLPVAAHAAIAGTRTGDGSNEFILNLLLRNRYIDAIEPWYHCDDAGTNGRSCLYVRDRRVVAGIVNQEYMTMEPERKGLCYEVIGTAKTGGVVVRHTKAIAYADNTLPS